MSHPDTNEIIHTHHGWDGKCFYDDTEPTKDQDTIDLLRSENAYLIGKIEVYEKFLKDRGFIKEEEMRELKFRFVDTGDGTVYKPITLVELCQQIEIPRRIVLESENGDFVDTDDFLDQLENGELIAEQYTGLKDKNGKEIYEGDIVSDEFEYGGEKAKTIWQVRWCDDECAFELHYVSGFEVDDCWLVSDDEENYKVIGNIHENPELLEEK